MTQSPGNLDGDLQDQSHREYHSDLGVTETRIAQLGPFTTDSGDIIPTIEVCYQTLGQLSPNKDNVVLICHALSGDAHVAGMNPTTNRPGWWDFHVGPNKAIDTNRFHVICSNVIGSCGGSTGPASINPNKNKPYGTDFPPVTLRDMVRAQTMLLDHLNIPKVLAVVGGSMGGMQALIWATDHPQRVDTCIPIATCMAHNAMQIAFNEVGRQAIMTDANWNDGDYYGGPLPKHGLAVARMVGHVTYLSDYAMHEKFGRRLQRPAEPDDLFPDYFSVESYLHYQGERFVQRFDPNAYLYLTKALDRFDLLSGRPAFEALGNVRARFLVISFDSDWLYSPDQSRNLVRLLKRSSIHTTYLNLTTAYGHDSFLIRNPEFSSALNHFLIGEYRRLYEQPQT
ncbi:MAG: homoserine O-acetyltransferase MetX [Limisphaerales bacterium]|jgi:homoserine O-acetyltransferase